MVLLVITGIVVRLVCLAVCWGTVPVTGVLRTGHRLMVREDLTATQTLLFITITRVIAGNRRSIGVGHIEATLGGLGGTQNGERYTLNPKRLNCFFLGSLARDSAYT